MKNACEQQWHTYMCIFAAGWEDCLHIHMYVHYIHVCLFLRALMCNTSCYILDCERVNTNVLCLCLNQPENTHVGTSAVFFHGSV